MFAGDMLEMVWYVIRERRPDQRTGQTHPASPQRELCGYHPVRDLVYFNDSIRDRVWRWGVGEMTRTADAVGSPVLWGLVCCCRFDCLDHKHNGEPTA
jgi:hypothetical protein